MIGLNRQEEGGPRRARRSRARPPGHSHPSSGKSDAMRLIDEFFDSAARCRGLTDWLHTVNIHHSLRTTTILVLFPSLCCFAF